jgi:hypothetical protein
MWRLKYTEPHLFMLLVWVCNLVIHTDMIYLWTAIGLPPGGSSSVHIYTKTINRTTQNKQYIEQHKNFGRVRAVPHLCGFYPGICLTTKEKVRKTLSQGSRRVPAGTTKIHKRTIRIRRHNNKNTWITVWNRNTTVHTLIENRNYRIWKNVIIAKYI